MAQGQRGYSEEKRRDVLADIPELGIRGAARKHGVSKTSAGTWWHQAQATSVTEKRQAEAPPKKDCEVTSKKASTSRGSGSSKSKLKKETSTSTSMLVPASPGKQEEKTVARIAKVYTPSQRAAALERVAEVGQAQASRELGISRFALWQWKQKTEAAARGEADSVTAGSSLVTIEEQRDAEILGEWRQHPGLGPSQVRNQLRRKGVKVCVNTVRRVMESAGYRPPKVERKKHDGRYEAVRPNHMWHLDFVHRNINRTNTFTLILLDDCARFVVGHGVDDAERADMVISTFSAAVERHGRPEMVMHDKGSAFWSWRGISRFTALLVELGIDQIPAEHKEWNGKVEVFNANLHKELFDVQRFYDVAEMKRRLAAHLEWYNEARTHHALGGLLVPADRYYGRAEQVLARIEAGAGRDPGQLLEFRDRCLELFKVVSRNGTPEIWLLGKKLLELAD